MFSTRVCSVLALGCAAVVVGQEAEPSASISLETRIDAYLGAMEDLGLFSGTVLLARQGRIVERAVGMADRDAGIANTTETRFKLMSVSKTFTGVAVLQLVEQGALRLEDSIAEHLPDCPDAWSSVTVHDLLDHTSGIPNLDVEWGVLSRRLHSMEGDASLAAIWGEFAPTVEGPLRTEPGSTSAYSNFNTILAGVVAEFTSGNGYPELVRERVLDPARLAETGFDDGRRHEGLAIGYVLGFQGGPVASEQNMAHIQPAGGYWSTVGDLYRFDRALRDDSLLGPDALGRLVTPRGPHTFGYACCFSTTPIHGRACIHHSGGSNGYVADFLRFVDDDACVVVLSNFAFAPLGRISHDLAALLFDVEVDLPIVVSGAALDAGAGVYSEGEGVFRVLRRSGPTLIAFSIWPGVARTSGQLLLPLGGGRFKAAAGEAVLTITARGDGTELMMEQRPVRRSTDVPSWHDVIGTWSTAGGDQTTIAFENGSLWLRSSSLWPAAAELVPVAADVALALWGPSGGVVIRRGAGVLTWDDYRGKTIELRRGEANTPMR